PLAVFRKHVITRLCARVACEPALGVVSLWRRACCGTWREGIGLYVVVEHGISPPAAVRKSLAVLHHEVDVDQVTGHRRVLEEGVRLWRPMDFGHPGPVRH